MIEADVVVVGAGPAGIAAATTAAHKGCSVVVVDDNASAGGQIWRDAVSSANGKSDSKKARAFAEFPQSGARLLAGRKVFDAPQPRVLRTIAEGSAGPGESLAWRRMIIATGARERFLPFPGWTLPGVVGAGGLQALARSGFPVKGKRIVVAGTGPLLLAVAFHLQQKGAKIVTIAEQAQVARLMGLAIKLWSHPAKGLQGIGYRAALGRVGYRTGCWVASAVGAEKVNSVQLTDGKRTWTESCDLLACGFHLVPNTELALLLGCKLDGDNVHVDGDQKTSVSDVYCAGEPTGIAGLDAALAQGQIAGLSAAGEERIPPGLRARRDREGDFGRAMDRAFALRPELFSLAANDTIVCRCEDVRYAELAGWRSWTEAKLQTRCGMGACQGRVCGPAVEALFGWKNLSIRPPLYPVLTSALCDHDEIRVTQESL